MIIIPMVGNTRADLILMILTYIALSLVIFSRWLTRRKKGTLYVGDILILIICFPAVIVHTIIKLFRIQLK